MGLDMYLSLKKVTYTSEYTNKDACVYPDELKGLESGISGRNFKSIQTFTDYLVGYWRKANAIHKWFVDNCADGIDECQPIFVDYEHAEFLLDLCERILKDETTAHKLLPTKEGFFFGPTSYDEWYFRDVKYTRDLLKRVLPFVGESEDKYQLVYHASW